MSVDRTTHVPVLSQPSQSSCRERTTPAKGRGGHCQHRPGSRLHARLWSWRISLGPGGSFPVIHRRRIDPHLAAEYPSGKYNIIAGHSNGSMFSLHACMQPPQNISGHSCAVSVHECENPVETSLLALVVPSTELLFRSFPHYQNKVVYNSNSVR